MGALQFILRLSRFSHISSKFIDEIWNTKYFFFTFLWSISSVDIPVGRISWIIAFFNNFWGKSAERIGHTWQGTEGLLYGHVHRFKLDLRHCHGTWVHNMRGKSCNILSWDSHQSAREGQFHWSYAVWNCCSLFLVPDVGRTFYPNCNERLDIADPFHCPTSSFSS